ncbi:MAG: EscN/YscN/HrcN family type III secretion system ATPase, partial [Halobacteriovoraceae bacterium]|nr:EscN/YscN/HrcN family type III secretion system ATPase [Halobacteriovoraceae bacterium]
MINDEISFKQIYREFESTTPYQNVGKILSSQGMLFEATLPRAVMGCCVEFQTQAGDKCLGEVVGINGERCKVMPYDDLPGINSETKVFLKDLTTTVNVSMGMLGRVVDFQGQPIDN